MLVKHKWSNKSDLSVYSPYYGNIVPNMVKSRGRERRRNQRIIDILFVLACYAFSVAIFYF